MEVEGELDNILDLTVLANIRAVANAMQIEGNIWDILADLISEETGGSKIPTLFGYYAQRNGYNGIFSFSARAISDEDAQHLRESKYWDEVMEDYEKTFTLERMQKRVDRMCLIVFSGSVLTRSIRRCRFDDGPWEDNPYLSRSEEEIDKLWGDYNSDYQATQGRVTYMRTDQAADSTSAGS